MGREEAGFKEIEMQEERVGQTYVRMSWRSDRSLDLMFS